MTNAATHELGSLAAIVLCGGQSRRMGRPKALLPFGPETLLQRMVRLVEPIAGRIVVVAAGEQPLPPLPADVLVARDRWPQAGPLAGLASGVATLAESPVSRLLVVGCDQPLLTRGWLEALLAAAVDRPLSWAAAGADAFPLPLVLARRLADQIEGLVAAGRRRLLDLAELAGPGVAPGIDTALLLGETATREALRNVNAPDDYLAALRLAGFDPPGAAAGLN